MTSPFKSSPQATDECNRCGEEFTYHPTYGTGRICGDCKDAVDDPQNCTYELDVDVDSTARTVSTEVTVSHDEPHTVHIPAAEVIEVNRGEYVGIIAHLTIEADDGDAIFEDVWATHVQNALRPHEKARLNINHDKVISCDGSRLWTTTWGESEDDDRIAAIADRGRRHGQPFEADGLNVTVRFPAIEDAVPNSTIRKTVDVPDYLIDL